ncbi:hypothetical protein KY285_030538 [Solanum tuberosum]|nr:hypothetical protein KY285_030538 [Solanum tuberosum]
MDTFNSPNTQMVVEVNYKLRNWWFDIKRDREREILQLLGGLTYLMFVIPNPHVIRVLLEFWDPVMMVFKFVDFDLTPTIEEISGFIDLPYHECEIMVPYKPSSREFLKSLGMKSNPTLPSLDLGGFISTFCIHVLAEMIVITLLLMSLNAPSRNGKHIA